MFSETQQYCLRYISTFIPQFFLLIFGWDMIKNLNDISTLFKGVTYTRIMASKEAKVRKLRSCQVYAPYEWMQPLQARWRRRQKLVAGGKLHAIDALQDSGMIYAVKTPRLKTRKLTKMLNWPEYSKKARVCSLTCFRDFLKFKLLSILKI